jgi:UDP-N-acetylmuramate dehydrogenase
MQVAHAVISLRKEKLPDPNEVGNVGSFFKNPVVSEEFAKALASQNPGLPVFNQNNQTKLSAGWLIESAGMKGVQRGEAAVSADHALVLTNLGAATARDVLGLAHEIQEAVMARFGLWLEPEPQIIPPV